MLFAIFPVKYMFILLLFSKCCFNEISRQGGRRYLPEAMKKLMKISGTFVKRTVPVYIFYNNMKINQKFQAFFYGFDKVFLPWQRCWR